MLQYSEIPSDRVSKHKSEQKSNKEACDSGCVKKANSCITSVSFKDKEQRKLARTFSKGSEALSQSYYKYGSAVPVHIKTQSLPNSARTNGAAALDCLRIGADEFAGQLTLLDLPSFRAIQPDELTSCAWNKKHKLTAAPNVVAMTRRFNQVSFWAVQEVLSGATARRRADILAHFVRIAKKLYELNNLHALFAIVSALQSAPVYRLAKTWTCLSKRDRQTFDKLALVFSDNNNWSNLRSHLESLKLPCIPFLGLYLTDLVYIDNLHPHLGGLESQQRTLKMNNILRIIADYQTSNYANLTPVPHIKEYLNSVRYIEELQKFVEDDQYKLSLKLEPPSPPASSSCCSSKESIADGHAAVPSLSPAKIMSESMRHYRITESGKFIPGHRKCQSLGTNIFSRCDQSGGVGPIDVPKALHLLDDSELEESDSSRKLHSMDLPAPVNLASETSRGNCEESSHLIRLTEDMCLEDQTCSMQGCVRRKTVLKHGRRPTVTSWQRYWIQIWSSSLAYFSPKSFKGTQRSDYKREPCKMVSLLGCQVQLTDSANQDMFQVVDHQRGNIYKFKAGTQSMAERWFHHIQRAARSDQYPLPANLMSFE